LIKRELFITYSQFCVFDAQMEQPFNDWLPSHERQGFAWRPGSISFGTLPGTGGLTVCVNKAGVDAGIAKSAIRGFRLPFEVPNTRLVEVATIGEGFQVSFEPGAYTLSCYLGREGTRMWCHLCMVLGECQEPRVLAHDSGLEPEYPLLMTAQPA
jgi:hypothetical protein